MSLNNSLQIVIPIAMLVAVYVSGRKCPMKQATFVQAAQPPSKVFGTVWPILYILNAYSMYRLLKRNQSDVMVQIAVCVTALALFASLCYIRVAGCKQDWKKALWVLVAYTALVFTQMMAAFAVDRVAGICIAPLAAWCVFAMILNVNIVNQNGGCSFYNVD